MNELVVLESQALTAVEVRAQVNLIQKVLKGVMINGVHYGTIPGTNKPTLYKPGAEIISSTFRMAPDPIVEDLSDDDFARHRVTCRMLSQQSGLFLGAGVGECSSNEEKYKWRKAICDEEYDETPEDRRRNAWKRGKGGKTYQVKQVRTNPADVANTILKMAKKRALVDAVLTITAASDAFDQDIEDLPEDLRGAAGEQAPQPKPTAEKKVTKPQVKRLWAIAFSKGQTEDTLKANLAAKMNYHGELDEMPRSIYEKLCEGLEKMPDKKKEEPDTPDNDPAGDVGDGDMPT